MKISKDKVAHFIVSLVIALAVSSLFANVTYPLSPKNPWTRSWISFAAAMIVTLAIGIWKEIRDSKQPGNHFCLYDLLADFAGAAAGSMCGFLTYLL